MSISKLKYIKHRSAKLTYSLLVQIWFFARKEVCNINSNKMEGEPGLWKEKILGWAVFWLQSFSLCKEWKKKKKKKLAFIR